MTETTAIEEIDITGAARANRAIGLAKASARVVYLIAAPLSAFALVFWALGEKYSFGAALGWMPIAWPVLFAVVLLGLSFALLSLRPILGAAFVALGAGPAVWEWFKYILAMDGEVASSVGFTIAWMLLFAGPLLWAWATVAPLDASRRAMARPAPPMRSPLTLLRTMFGVWPGLKRSWASALIGSVAIYVSTVIAAAIFVLVVVVAVLQAAILPLMMTSTEAFGTKYLDIVGNIVITLLAIWLAVVLQTLLRGGARWLSRASLAQQVKRDARAPILFLRSFQDDQVTLRDPSPLVRFWRRVFTLGFGVRRLDHILVEQFSRYGPALALGSPGEKDLPFGAARVYVTHDTWKDKVAEVAAAARSVVLVADMTPGVEWEIRTFMDGPWREKTLFVCAPKSGDVRGNPVLAERFAALGVAEGGDKIVAAWWTPSGALELLRTREAIAPETLTVALQAFFRAQDGEI